MYHKAIELQPTHAELYVGLGKALQHHGEFWEAITTYEKAIAFNPGNAEVYLQLADVLTLVGEEEKALLNRFQALTLEPSWVSPEEHFALGNRLREIGKLEQAEICYQRVLKFNPDFAAAYGQLGKVFTQQQQWEKAIESYQQAIERDPQQPECYQD
ncbi:MAG: tetratricopeptide repeat protein [Microcoleaceae cyanobacterium]